MVQPTAVLSGMNNGEDVPVAVQVESVLGCKWSIQLLQLVADGCSRPSAILRACPGLSAKVMNERWRMMVRFGIVRRTVFGERPPIQVEYALTPFGRRFIRILDEVRRLQEDVDDERVAIRPEQREDEERRQAGVRRP